MPTLAALRAATTDRLAPHIPGTTGVANAAGTSYTGRAADGNTRRIISSDLLSIDAGETGAEDPPDALKNEWLYLLTSPPQQRRIPEGALGAYATASEVATGYSGSGDQPVAYVDLERPLMAVAAPGTPFEIHAIPPLRAGRSMGVHAAINRALRVMLREDTVTVTGDTGTYRYDVTATFPWITRPDQFVSAHYVETVSGLDTWAIPGATLRFDANTVLLVPNSTFTDGQSIPVRVLRPLSSWIKAGGSWGESSVGLVDEDDECLGDLDAIALVAACHLAEEQAQLALVGSSEQKYWLARAKDLIARTPFLRDQQTRKPADTSRMFPDYISPYGPFGGRWGPGFR